jgi:hypothetical protein
MVESVGESSNIGCRVEEKKGESREKAFEPINRTESGDRPRRLSRQNTASSIPRPLYRVCSLSDGYSLHAIDAGTLGEPISEEEEATGPEGEFVVKWDGPGDRDNPRNMNLARKWLIVLVLSSGAACVYGIFLCQFWITAR